MNENKVLYIIRGLPGSGKTTFCNSLNFDFIIAADDFPGLYNEENKINFSKLKHAHQWCKDSIEKELSDTNSSKKKFVVNNTFTKKSEIEPYIEIAKKYNCKYFVLIVENWNNTSSIHNVPDETISIMKNRFYYHDQRKDILYE